MTFGIEESNRNAAFIQDADGYDVAVINRVESDDPNHTLTDEQWQELVDFFGAAYKAHDPIPCPDCGDKGSEPSDDSPVTHHTPDNSHADTQDAAEARIWSDYNEALHSTLAVTEIDGYRGEDSVTVKFDEPVRVRVIDTDVDDLQRWMDTHGDPVWTVEAIDKRPELEGLRSMWVYGHSYTVATLAQYSDTFRDELYRRCGILLADIDEREITSAYETGQSVRDAISRLSKELALHDADEDLWCEEWTGQRPDKK